MTVEQLVLIGCFVPLLVFAVSIFACELRIQHRENETRRYPRYGQSPEMRTKGKSRVKREGEDKET